MDDGSAVFFRSDGIFQLMCYNPSGKLHLHVIDQPDATPDPLEYMQGLKFKSMLEMQLNTPFALLPKVFSETGIPGSSQNTVVHKLTDKLLLSHPIMEHPSFHAAIPLYDLSSEKSKNRELYLFCAVFNQICFVFFYREGFCELANSYPVSNDSEVLYFCLAAIKKGNADVNKVVIEILGDKTAEVIGSFERFVPSVSKFRIELPYNAGEYPPFAAISLLLHHYCTCELPAEV